LVDPDDLTVGRAVSKPSVGAADVTPSPEMPKLGSQMLVIGTDLLIIIPWFGIAM
jgi:hypothetical protein